MNCTPVEWEIPLKELAGKVEPRFTDEVRSFGKKRAKNRARGR